MRRNLLPLVHKRRAIELYHLFLMYQALGDDEGMQAVREALRVGYLRAQTVRKHRSRGDSLLSSRHSGTSRAGDAEQTFKRRLRMVDTRVRKNRE